MVEITLKRRARTFAEKYDVSYTRALAAVDEPLHRLRDELYSSRFARPGFQLTDSEDELLDPVSGEDAGSPLVDFSRTLRGTGIRPLTGASQRWRAELLGELSRRMVLFADAKVRDILEYRSLYRAGLAPENLDFLPHYYHNFGDFERSLVALGTARYGIVEVAVLQDRFTARQWRESDGTVYDLPIPESQRGSRRLKKITWAELQELLHPSGS